MHLHRSCCRKSPWATDESCVTWYNTSPTDPWYRRLLLWNCSPDDQRFPVSFIHLWLEVPCTKQHNNFSFSINLLEPLTDQKWAVHLTDSIAGQWLYCDPCWHQQLLASKWSNWVHLHRLPYSCFRKRVDPLCSTRTRTSTKHTVGRSLPLCCSVGSWILSLFLISW